MEEDEATNSENNVFQCFICGLCDLKFANRNDLDLHNQLHAGTGFSCPLCKAILPDMHQLQLHDLQHSLSEAQGNDDNLADFDIFSQPSEANICIMCGEGFATEEELLMHCALHADDPNDVQEVHVEDHEDDGFEEPIQVREGDARVVLAKKSFHRPSRPVSRRPPASFERDKAPEAFENSFRQNYLMAEEDLYYLSTMDDNEEMPARNPKRRRSRNYSGSARKTCDQCKKVFSNSFSLKRHKSITHLNKRPYVCTICRKTFLQMRMLLRHSAHHHMPHEEIFTCEHCSGEFFELGSLHHHFQEVHNMQYNCEACFKFFVEKDEYLDHMKEHITTFGFDCCRCRRRYKNDWELQRHRCVQDGSRPYLCKICGKRFLRKFHLTRHFSVHQQYAGNIVDYAVKIEYDSDGVIEEPIRLNPRNRNKIRPPKYDDIIHYKNGRRTMLRKRMNFKCYICDIKWPTLRRYKQHFLMTHKGVKFNSCHICGKQFSTAYRVRRHLTCHDIGGSSRETVDLENEPAVWQGAVKDIADVYAVAANAAAFEEENAEDNIHARGRDYQCYICSKKCDNLRRFKLHFKAQHKNVEFNSCHICSKQFPNTFKVKRHLVSHFVQVKKELVAEVEQVDSVSKVLPNYDSATILANFDHVNTYGRGIPKTYSCYICNKNCRSYKRYKEHFFSEHEGIELNACHLCNKQFSTTSKVKRHIITHTNERKYRCHACGKRFAQFVHLKRHRALMHTVKSQRLRKCMYCSKLYADKSSFEKHVLMHELALDSNFECTVCQEKFAEEKLLDEHILAFHDFFKKYQCTVCRRRFHRQSYLNRHMMVHTGLRKWKCFKCNRRFQTKTDLSRHTLTHSDLKPYPCFFCEKHFTRSANRQKHMSMFHEIRNLDAYDDEEDIKPFQDLTEKQKMILMTFN